jgi:hypothetical protein
LEGFCVAGGKGKCSSSSFHNRAPPFRSREQWLAGEMGELKALFEKDAPAGAGFTWGHAKRHSSIGREPLAPKTAEVLAPLPTANPP